MTRQYVLLVHGIGAHAATTWASTWEETLVAALQNYGEFREMSGAEIRADHLEFVPISYDQVFVAGYRDRWGDLAGAIAGQDGLVPADVTAALGALRDEMSGEQTSILWDHVLDVVLWFGVPQARQAVIAHVNAQLAAALERLRDENGDLDRAHVVAHSLGTSVFHDAAVCLSRGALTERAFEGRNFKWRTVTMVANTSRVMQAWMPLDASTSIDDFDVHESDLQPGRRQALLCRRYFNARHRADPVTWPRQFDPTAWDRSAYSDIELRRYGDLAAVHDFATYFANPLLHVPVLRAILGRNGLCTRAERDAAWQTFEQTNPNLAGTEFSDLRAIVQGDSAREHGVVDLARFLVRAFQELRR